MGGISEGPDHVKSLEDFEAVMDAAEELYEDELAVLREVAEALLHGQTAYGWLDLANDPRDFVDEAFQESRDWLAYRAMHIVQERKRR